MAKVKIIGEADLECGKCLYAKGSMCTHPNFKHLTAKPLIIAELGDTHPAFCPLENTASPANLQRSTP